MHRYERATVDPDSRGLPPELVEQHRRLSTAMREFHAVCATCNHRAATIHTTGADGEIQLLCATCRADQLLNRNIEEQRRTVAQMRARRKESV
jgi:hypothetical protein